MRFSHIFVSIFFFMAAASAAELKIKVVDPQSAAVAGAQVLLLAGTSSKPVAVQTTTAEGLAVFHVAEGFYQAQVLAQGFAPQISNADKAAAIITITLRVAPASETVVVSATRTPVPSQTAGVEVETLSGAQIQAMNPVDAGSAVRFLPGAIVNTAGRRGGFSSLFVRGGDSRYNKVILDGIPVTDPGGTFNFALVPLSEAGRMEFVRGAQSTLYGSDAMTSVLQVWSRNGSTRIPELRFGSDGGNYGTAHGYASLAGARGRFDYNLFGDQFNTTGQGINDNYSNSLQGGNIGVVLSDQVSFRLRARHSNSFNGVQGEWGNFGGTVVPPDTDQWARQNDLLTSAELTVAGPSRWQHRFTGYDYRHIRTNVDTVVDPARSFLDFLTHSVVNINQAGFEYQGDYIARSWARTTVGYEFADENGYVSQHAQRLNHAVYGEEVLTLKRLSIVAGARFVHNENFGNKGVPRVALTFQALKGGQMFSGTRFRFSYATGIKDSRLEEQFANGPGIIPNPNLKAEENRAFETGVDQSFLGRKYTLSATYYNNLFHNQIDFAILDFNTFTGEYANIDKSMAHGAEVELHGRPLSRLSFDAAYNYASTQILEQPFAFDSLHMPGRPLLRRPKHSASLLLTYLGRRWGANLGESFVGRRPDSDFLVFAVDHAPGYVRMDIGGWYAINSRVTTYVNVENALNRHYEEVVGYPALGANVRVGVRFRIGGE